MNVLPFSISVSDLMITVGASNSMLSALNVTEPSGLSSVTFDPTLIISAVISRLSEIVSF